MATISNLPKDVMEEIISRVPLKLMKEVRLTCKNWNNLSKTEIFTKLHVSKLKARDGEGTMMIAMISQELYLTFNFFVDSSIEIIGKLVHPKNVCITRVIHYEGLLLCILKDVTRVIVLNPYLGQARSIHLRHSPQSHRFNYGLGYADKESCRTFKLLRFLDYYYYVTPERQFYWYEMYDFDSGLWTTLDVANPHWGIDYTRDSVSLKGNVYWLAKERRSEDYGYHIICFDFTRERFGPLLPLPDDMTYPSVSLSCVEEEKLAVLYQDANQNEFEIWITTKIEAETVSWCKFLRIMDTIDRIYHRQTSFFFDEEKKVFMALDEEYPKTFINIFGEARSQGRDQHFLGNLVPNAWQHEKSQMWSYVPSSAQIKKLKRRKRKRQSRAEKRRFDQKIAAFEVYSRLLLADVLAIACGIF